MAFSAGLGYRIVFWLVQLGSWSLLALQYARELGMERSLGALGRAVEEDWWA